MTQFAVAIFFLLVGLIVSQGMLVAGFVRVLRRKKRPEAADRDCPKTAAVLCLRGSDPFLADCVEALLDQDYPNFEIKVVVDDRDDPAWRIVQEVVQRRQATNVEIQPLTERRQTCSLKCSSVVQAVSGLDESFEVLALLDADTIPHRSWLRELVAPLADDRIGAATGNRWYMPGQASWGSLVRYVWNAAAVVQMFWYQIAWGGTLAIKTKIFRESDLLQRWGSAFCEDTMLFKELRKQGLRVAFVESLMMINRENCSIGNYFGWVKRQLLTARLYHPGWLAVVGHGIGTALAPAAALVALIVALLQGDWNAAAWAGGGLVFYQAAMLLLLAPMEMAVRSIVRRRGESPHWITAATLIKIAIAMPVTQVIYSAALTSAMLLRTVEWRGVHYRIDGSWKIRLIDDRPYQEASSDAVASL